MKKIVISGSSKLEEKINYWCKYFKDKGYKILDYPKKVRSEDLSETYINFYQYIENTDILFIMNEAKDGVEGYIGPSTFAELTYAVMQNQNHNKHIEIYILNMPCPTSICYNEIKLFLNNKWINIFNKDQLS